MTERRGVLSSKFFALRHAKCSTWQVASQLDGMVIHHNTPFRGHLHCLKKNNFLAVIFFFLAPLSLIAVYKSDFTNLFLLKTIEKKIVFFFYISKTSTLIYIDAIGWMSLQTSRTIQWDTCFYCFKALPAWLPTSKVLLFLVHERLEIGKKYIYTVSFPYIWDSQTRILTDR